MSMKRNSSDWDIEAFLAHDGDFAAPNYGHMENQVCHLFLFAALLLIPKSQNSEIMYMLHVIDFSYCVWLGVRTQFKTRWMGLLLPSEE